LLKDYEGKLAAKGVVAGVAIEIAKSKVDSARALIDQETKRLESLALEQAAMTARRDALNKRFELLADEIEAKGESAARVKAATARWTKARVAVDEAQLRLDRMSVVSPIDGRVYQLDANPGTTLSAGTGPIANTDGMTVATLYRPEMLQVRVDVRFEDIPKVALHQSVEIANPALAEPLIGRVLFVSSEANIQKNTLEVKVEIPDPPSVLKPEMLVDTTFLAPKPDVPDQDTARELKLYIPAILLGQEQNASFVWIADRTNGVARKIEIETGPAAQDGLVEVIRGLNVSNRLISSGRESLRDGDRIRITGEESATFVSQPNPNHQLSDDHATN
jgi:RND family efflux transporter MFP subunit